VADDVRSFVADLRRFAEKTRIRSDKVVRKVTFDLLGEVTRRTPVDMGWARANWQLGIEGRPMGTVGEQPKRIKANKAKHGVGHYESAKAVANQQMSNFSSVKAGGVNYIVNNVPYIMALENGSSKQAPGGMARLTVVEFQDIVWNALRAV
jgi:hypothetical protein